MAPSTRKAHTNRDRVDVRQNHAFGARVGGALFAAGATLAATSLALPHKPHLDETGIGLIAIGAYITAGLLFAFAKRFSLTGLQFANVCGILLVTGCIYFSGEATSSYVVLYLWTGLYGFYFLTLRRALFNGLLTAIAYALVPFGSHQL